MTSRRSRFRGWSYRAWHFHIWPNLRIVLFPFGHAAALIAVWAVVLGAVYVVVRLIDWLSWP